jgi:nicotinamidase-related amidase
MESYLAPELERAALLTIDVQRDTLDGQPGEIPGTSAIVPKVKRVVEWFRSRSRPIIHVVRLYFPDGSNVDLCRKRAVENGARIFLVGSEGTELADGLLPRDDIRLDSENLFSGKFQQVGEKEWLMYKPRWGAFYKTPLEKHLRAINVSTVVFAGCNYPNCPRSSIYEASERDFRIMVLSDAISKFDENARKELESIGIVVESVDSLLV